jgi:stearoyl-CoA desaturase (delta-9 desaturase)
MTLLTKANIFNIFFIGLTTGIALIGTPLYIHFYGITTAEILVLLAWVVSIGMSVTVGYHRLFAHVTYKTNNFVRFVLLFLGAASFEQSALAWASQHRDHHKYVDTEADPYSIKKGFFWAHMGWLFFGNYRFFYANVADLVESKLVMNQARYYPLWSLTAGVLVPVLVGALMGHALGAFILCVCLRTVIVHHGTWCINSVCHTFGKATYDAHATARDHWLTAFVTFGEGHHNFHHRFANDYRNGVKWYHWDPSKWTIFILEKLGMAWNVKRASEFRILDARLKASNQLALEALDRLSENHQAKNFREKLHEQHELLRSNLTAWEQAAKEWYAHRNERARLRHQPLQLAFRDKMTQARKAFLEVERQWRHFTEQQIPGLVQAS